MLPTAKRVLAKQATGLMARAHAYSLGAQRQRLVSTLAVLEQKDGQLNHSSLSAFTAAKKLGGTVHGFIAGSGVKSVAQEIAKAEGVEKIIAVDNAAYEKVRPTLIDLDYINPILTLNKGFARDLCSPFG
jgi:electron transfer flavoprotein alpha subunit